MSRPNGAVDPYLAPTASAEWSNYRTSGNHGWAALICREAVIIVKCLRQRPPHASHRKLRTATCRPPDQMKLIRTSPVDLPNRRRRPSRPRVHRRRSSECPCVVCLQRALSLHDTHTTAAAAIINTTTTSTTTIKTTTAIPHHCPYLYSPTPTMHYVTKADPSHQLVGSPSISVVP